MGKDLKGKELGTGISQRKNGIYFGRFTTKYGQRLNFYDPKLSELKRKLIKAKYEDENGLAGTGEAVTVERWMSIWFENYKDNSIREVTKKSYRSAMVTINKHIGRMFLKNIRPLHIIQMMNSMHAQGYANGTIKGVKSVAYNMLQKAVENRLIASNPAAGIRVTYEEDAEVEKALSINEQKLFVNSIEDSHYRELFNVMLLTGLRISEALGLRWSDIDWEKKEMKIVRNFVTVKVDGHYQYSVNPTKTKSSRRVIPLCDEAIVFLKVQKAKKLNSKSKENIFNDLVFLSRSGKTCTYTNISRILRSKTKRIRRDGHEIQDITSHKLRHTFATRCYESGINLKTISKILGHSRIETTADIYTHVLPENAQAEISKLHIVGLEVS